MLAVEELRSCINIFAASYPYWPAVIFEPDDSTLKPDLLKEYKQQLAEEKRLRTKRKIYIVQFYDTRKSWCVSFTIMLQSTIRSQAFRVRGIVPETEAALLAEDAGTKE